MKSGSIIFVDCALQTLRCCYCAYLLALDYFVANAPAYDAWVVAVASYHDSHIVAALRVEAQMIVVRVLLL